MKSTNTVLVRGKIIGLQTLCAGFLLLAGAMACRAADGIWSSPAAGAWSNPGNWLSGAIADGAGSTAYFTNDITADTIVHLDTPRTNGSIAFGDGDTSTPANWLLDNNGTAANILTLSGAPTITVNALGAGNLANISAIVTGSNLTETGPGLLVLSGANTFTNLVINGGRVVFNTANGNGSLGAATTNNTITLTNGATLIRSNTANNLLWCLNVKGVNTFDGTGATGGNLNGMFLGDGTLNMILPPGGSSLTTGGNNSWNSNVWANFTGTVILSGGGNLRFDANNAATTTFGSRFATFDLGVTNTMNERGASGVAIHTTFLGALRGGPGTAMSTSGTSGTTNTFQIGDANLSTTFSGKINNASGLFTAVTKSGTGTLTLDNTNGYSGATVIQNGTLALAPIGNIRATISITIVSNATFDVSAGQFDGVSATNDWSPQASQTLAGNGTIAGNVTASVGTISPGNPTNFGVLNISSNLMLNAGATVSFKAGSGSNDQMRVTGNLALNTVTVKVSPPAGASVIPNGSYPLFTWNGTLIGDASGVVLVYSAQPGIITLATNLVTKQVLLQVSGASVNSVTWKGDGTANNWDHSSIDWLNGAVPGAFAELDNVIFDDSGSINPPVNIVDVVDPSSVVVNNTNKNYIFTSGGGKISGLTGLTKNGPGQLILAEDNDYAGATTINAGIIQVGNGGTSGTLGAGPLLNNATLVYERSDIITYASPLTGPGTLVQNGTNGTLILTGDSANSGGILVSAGTLQLGDGTSIHGSTTSVITNNATLQYNYNADATIPNLLAGNGNVFFDVSAGIHTYTIPTTVISTNFAGSLNVDAACRVHASDNNAGFILGNGSQVVVNDSGQMWCDRSATNYNSSFVLTGLGWPGDATALGALRIFACTITGPVNLAGDARIGGTINEAIIRGQVSGPHQLEVLGTTVESFILTLAPTNVNAYGSTLVTSGTLQAGTTNAFTNAITMGSLGRLRLNGNNITIAELSGGLPVSGTNCMVYNFNTTNAATLTVGTDGNSTEFDGVFADGASQPLGLTKVGAGTFTLTADSTNTGPVTVAAGKLALQPNTGSGSFSNATVLAVSNGAILDVSGRSDQTLTLNSGQTLKGSGIVSGNLTTVSGSTINPGDTIGKLTIQNNATLAGTLLMELNRTNATATNDMLIVNGTLSAGGALMVVNRGPALHTGDTFQLFPVGVNGFTVNLQTNDIANNANYTWNNTLGSNGKITVTGVSSAINPNPTNIDFSVNGGNINLSWPPDHTGWTLQAQTNGIGVGITTNWVNVAGSAATNQVTITNNPANGSSFFRLALP